MQAEYMANVPRQFNCRDGTSVMKTTLSDVIVNNTLNFMVMSVTHLLEKGWKIMLGDSSGLMLTHENDGAIVEDIKVPTKICYIFACLFVSKAAEVSAISTYAGMKLSVQRAHEFLDIATRMLQGELQGHVDGSLLVEL